MSFTGNGITNCYPDQVEDFISITVLRADASAETISDADFLATAKQFADDTVLLLSLSARQWVVWYQYTYSSTQGLIFYRLDSSRPVSGKYQLRAYIAHGHLQEFLRVCVPVFHRFRANGQDLRMPILFWLTGQDASSTPYLESRFALAVMALEKLLGVLRSSLSIPTAKWRTTSLKKKIETACDFYRQSWTDLYPSGYGRSTPMWIETRNRLFHEPESVDPKRLGVCAAGRLRHETGRQPTP